MLNVYVEVFMSQIFIWYVENDVTYEVVMWTEDEWKEDPSIVPNIANAVRMAYEDPEQLLIIHEKHIASQKKIKEERNG